ncbi:MAG: PilN domain-containing protein [Deltaproteobacteria bacterium]|nr:PilN domain-containing protein [Deltaproteobacteria bacterium]
MIRINLLPFRAAKRRENIRRQATIYALCLLFTVSVIGYSFIQKTSELSSLKGEEGNINTELATYQKELNEIKQLEQKIKEIKNKLGVIKKLEAGKAGPVLLLDELSMAVPKDKLWIKSFNESKGSLSLTGTAMDNETVALFMDNLKKAEHINSVELQSATKRDLAQYKLKVSDFVLKCVLNQ